MNHLENQTLSANIDAATVREAYTWAFSEAIRAGSGGIMCSYNKLNGTLTCQNDGAVNGLLKQEVRFPRPPSRLRADTPFFSSMPVPSSYPTGRQLGQHFRLL
jgi:hypothetical protein